MAGPGTKITIEVQAMLDQANQQLNALFTTLGEGSKKVEKSNQGIDRSANGIKQLKDSSRLARESFEGLQGVLLMLGGPHLEALNSAVMTARMGLMSLKSSAELTGLGLGTMVPVFGAVAVALGGGLWAWSTYRKELEDVGTAAKKTAEHVQLLLSTSERIQGLATARAISPGSADFYQALIRGKTLIGKELSGSDLAFLQKLQGERSAVGGGGNDVGRLTTAELRQLNDYLVQKGLLVKTGDEKNPSYEYSAAVKGQQTLRNLGVALAGEGDTPLEKKIRDITERFTALREQARAAADAIEQGTGRMSAAGPTIDRINTAEQDALRTAEYEDRKEREAQAAEAAEKRKVELAQEASRQQEDLERALTLQASAEGKTREEVYERDFQARMFLYTQLKYAGEIAERDYTNLVAQATAQRNELRKREAEKLVAQQNAQNEINLARIQGQRQLVSKDQDMSRLQRQAAVGELLRQENQLIEQNIALNRSRVADTSLDPTAHLTAAKQLQDLELRQAENQQAMADLQAQSSFIGSMRRGINELNSAWSDLGKNFADTALNSMQLSVQAVSQSITDAIWRTRSWGQAFSQIGKTIVSSLIQIVTQYVASKLAMMAIDAIYHKQSQAQAATTTATSGAAGVAQAGAQGGWVGVLIYLAVFAAAIAAVMAIASGISGGFAEGGRPPVGRPALVGELGPELFVPDTEGTILPADQTTAYLRGYGSRAGSSPRRQAAEKLPRVVIVSDERKLRDMETDPEFRNMIIRINEENRWRYR